MTKIASVTILVVGSGWMNQTISLAKTVELLRPFESYGEARDFSLDTVKQLKATSRVQPITGLLNRGVDFGDFQSVTDVQLTYVTEEYTEAYGLVAHAETTTTTREKIAEFTDDDSYAATAEYEEEHL